MKKTKQLLVALALAIGFSLSAKADSLLNLVPSGDFETFTTGVLASPWWGSGQTSVVANDGTFSPSNPSGQTKILYFGDNSPQAGTTVGLLEAGKDYTLSIDLCAAWAVSGSAFASLNGYDGSLPEGQRSQTFASNSFDFNNSWSRATLSLSAATITQSYSSWIGKELNIVIRKNSGYLSIDNVAVTAVPEPSTYALLFGGILTLLLIRRRRIAS
jgi:hypothetical protein